MLGYVTLDKGNKYMYDKDNVFAKIARGEIPTTPIVQNEHALSFRDINPLCATHVLIIPRGEYENILDFVQHASSAEQEGFWACFRETAEKLGVDANYNVSANAGADAPIMGQSVMHFHLHLIAGAPNPLLKKIFQCKAEQ